MVNELNAKVKVEDIPLKERASYNEISIMDTAFYLIAYSVLLDESVKSVSVHPKLLVVSFDGFQNNYLQRNLTPTFEKLGEENVRAKYVQNIFPTKTYSNHFAMATGFYSETTGILGNSIYDASKNTVVNYGYDMFHFNNSIIPLWLFNEETEPSRHSGNMMWPGGEFQYRNKSTTFQMTLAREFPWKERVDTVISWFTNDTTPANLVMLYFEQPDSVGHKFGPNSRQVNEQIEKADETLGYLMSSLNKSDLLDVNVVLLSDHGMAAVTIERIINLTSIVGHHKSYGESPLAQIYPEEGKENLVYQKLKDKSKENGHFRIFKREEIPDKFHYKKSALAPPILALADLGYAFESFLETIEMYEGPYSITQEFGVHGYDPKEDAMHPFFIASGAAFKKRYYAEVLRTIDFFPAFTKILGINTTNYPTEGSFDKISHILL